MSDRTRNLTIAQAYLWPSEDPRITRLYLADVGDVDLLADMDDILERTRTLHDKIGERIKAAAEGEGT